MPIARIPDDRDAVGFPCASVCNFAPGRPDGYWCSAAHRCRQPEASRLHRCEQVPLRCWRPRGCDQCLGPAWTGFAAANDSVCVDLKAVDLVLRSWRSWVNPHGVALCRDTRRRARKALGAPVRVIVTAHVGAVEGPVSPFDQKTSPSRIGASRAPERRRTESREDWAALGSLSSALCVSALRLDGPEGEASYVIAAAHADAPASRGRDVDDRGEERTPTGLSHGEELAERSRSIETLPDDADCLGAAAHVPENLRRRTAGRTAVRRDQNAIRLRLPGAARAVVEEVADHRPGVDPRDPWCARVGRCRVRHRGGEAGRRDECRERNHDRRLTPSATA